jgi:hypothetical protein
VWSGGERDGEGSDGLWWPPMRHDHLRIASSGKCGDPVNFAAWQLLLSMLCSLEEAGGSELAAAADALKAAAVPVVEEEPQGQPSAAPPPRPPPLPPISPDVEAGIVASQCSSERRAEVAAAGMGPLMDWGCEVESVSEEWLASAGLACSWQCQRQISLRACRWAFQVVPTPCAPHCFFRTLPTHCHAVPRLPPAAVQCPGEFVEHTGNYLRATPRFASLRAMLPCDLWSALRGRTLWLVGDSQALYFYKQMRCFLDPFLEPEPHRRRDVDAVDDATQQVRGCYWAGDEGTREGSLG